MPAGAIVQDGRLIIRNYYAARDSGIYTCRAIGQDGAEMYASHLVASNDYLLEKNPYFSFEKDEEDESKVIVRCRPDTDSYPMWQQRGGSNGGADETGAAGGESEIDGDVLRLSRASEGRHFTCNLNSDSEFGPITLELEATSDLIERALNRNAVAAADGVGADGDESAHRIANGGEEEEETPTNGSDNNNNNNEQPAEVNGSDVEISDESNSTNADVTCQPGEDC